MFGLDESLAHLSGGGALALVLIVSLLLGLRHASDPDHLAAVTTLAAGTEVPVRRAAQLGFAWGAGHATSLFLLGLPIVFWRAFLPYRVQQGAEAVVGVLIIGLALWLLSRWWHGTLSSRAKVRSQATAYGIGVVHGAGGSAGICILLLAAIPDRWLALASLAVFSFGTCLSMAILSAGFGRLLGGRGALRIAPVFGALSLVFGVWYVLAAVNVV
jgi:ABC-type nickel/cobalt efflux system permease component RcnA